MIVWISRDCSMETMLEAERITGSHPCLKRGRKFFFFQFPFKEELIHLLMEASTMLLGISIACLVDLANILSLP